MTTSEKNMNPDSRTGVSASRDAQILSQIKDAVICTDTQGIVTFWNEAAFRVWGWTAAEMIGRSVFERLPEGTARDWGRSRFNVVLDGEESFGDRHDYRKDGSRVWVEVRSTQWKDNRGLPAGVLTIARDITERKQAQEKLRQSETMMAAAQRLAHFGSWELDLQNDEVNDNTLRWSDECYRIFGYLPGSVRVTNELFFGHIPVEEHEPIRQAVAKAIAERGVYTMDHRVVLVSGEIRHVHEHAQVFADERTGQPLKMVGTVQDVTERIKAERSFKLFRALVDRSSDVLEVIDPDTGRFLDVNEKECQELGYSREELLTMRVWDIDTVMTESIWPKFAEEIRSGGTLSGEYFHRRKDGSVFPVEVNARWVQLDQNYIVATVRNISERKQAVQALRESEEQFRSAMQYSSIGMALVAPTGRWLRVNQALCHIVGYSEAELLAIDFQTITHPDDLSHDLELLRKLSLGEIQTYQMEKRYFHKLGHIVWILLSVSVVRDPNGRPRYFISQIQDISDRKQVMEELVLAKDAAEGAARAKSEFLAMISHEIRTPLNPILGAVQLLLDQESSPEQRELLQVIHSAGEHLLTLLNDILDLAKVEAGVAQLSLNSCRVSELVQGVLDIKREEARAKRLTLSAEWDKDLAYCYFLDEPRLRQILLNLIGNAVKFTSVGGITVQVERTAQDSKRDQLRFSVCDTGIGLRPDHARRIFDPFYQVDSSPKRRYEGAGLGLAICQRLIHMMAGEIGVDSKLGEGATFWFSVWLERRRSMDDSGTPWPMPLKSVHHRRILLAVPVEQDRLLLTTALERAECEVTPATCAAHAIARFQPGAYDLILLDEGLLDLDCREVVGILREREQQAGVAPTAVILQALQAEEADLRKAKQAGFTSVLAKPIRHVQLMRLLASHAPLPPMPEKPKV